MSRELHVVTGAFGYTGQYIARRLVDAGKRVVTLTGHPNRPNPFGKAVEARPFDFDNRDRLEETLRGAAALYNTYWVRFDRGESTFERAVSNTTVLFDAARRAGVGRVVHVSIANPSEDSPLPYYRGKAVLERRLRAPGLPYAILRPTVIFGREDILINNIAWFARRFPLFGVPGDGRYRVQPIYVEDMADLAVREGARTENVVADAVGPETYTFAELVTEVGRAVGRRVRLARVPPGLALAVTTAAGWLLGDVVLTREEALGLMAGLLASSQTPTGHTRLSAWMQSNAATLGKRYASEVARHYDRPAR